MDADAEATATEQDSLDLILELQFQDLQEIFANAKGKGVAGKLCDGHLALQAFEEELKTQRVISSDRRLARSIDQAVHTGGEAIAQATIAESVASSDRNLACRLAGVRAPVKPAPIKPAPIKPSPIKPSPIKSAPLKQVPLKQAPSADDINALVKSRSKAPNDNTDHQPTSEPQSDEAAASSSKAVLISKANAHPVNNDCVVCLDTFLSFEIAEAPCGHRYCGGCLEELFANATIKESHFPPTCCQQNIPLNMVREFLDYNVATRFEEKSLEFGSINRTYCSAPTCSKFIPPSHFVGDVAQCPACDQSTCTICKSTAHEGDCPQDTELQNLLAAAAEYQWQRCYECSRLVELNHGCHHIT